MRGMEPRRAHTKRREPAYGYAQLEKLGRTVKTMRDEIAKGTANKHRWKWRSLEGDEGRQTGRDTLAGLETRQADGR